MLRTYVLLLFLGAPVSAAQGNVTVPAHHVDDLTPVTGRVPWTPVQPVDGNKRNPGASTVAAGTAVVGTQVHLAPTGDAGAAINTAFSTYSTVVVSSTSMTATTVITIPNASTGANSQAGMLEIRGGGTFATTGIRFQDSTTATFQSGTLWCPDHATIKLANGANTDLVSDTNFSSLTGTTNGNGAFGSHVIGCVLDGNRANNSSGWPLRIYGRDLDLDATVQNGASGGAWLENHDAGSFSSPDDDDAQFASTLRAIANNGDGLYIPQGQGWTFDNYIGWGNSTWGAEIEGPVTFHMGNVFLDASGGVWCHGGCSIIATNFAFSSAAGWGLLQDVGTGADSISASTFGCNGCTALEVRSPNQVISGTVANSTIGVKFNGGDGIFSFASFSNTTVFNCASIKGNPIVSEVNLTGAETIFDAATCGSATVPPGQGSWTVNTTNSHTFSTSAPQIHVAGWTLTYPKVNGTIQATSGSNIVYRCTTAGTLPVGALTTDQKQCGASTNTGLMVN